MPIVNRQKNGYSVSFTKGEREYFEGFTALILAKKRARTNRNCDRVSAEMGEAAIDSILEYKNINRFWSRGQFHYDFSNLNRTLKAEVKTRKFYTENFEDLDVRIDYKEYDNAKEANFFIPVVYEITVKGTSVISAGAFDTERFISGCKRYTSRTPKAYHLKDPCFRVEWKTVFQYPKDYGYHKWEEFLKLW